jgi:hypothetical protein
MLRSRPHCVVNDVITVTKVAVNNAARVICTNVIIKSYCWSAAEEVAQQDLLEVSPSDIVITRCACVHARDVCVCEIRRCVPLRTARKQDTTQHDTHTHTHTRTRTYTHAHTHVHTCSHTLTCARAHITRQRKACSNAVVILSTPHRMCAHQRARTRAPSRGEQDARPPSADC